MTAPDQSKAKNIRPLGPVLYIVENEAITFPLTAFKGKGSKVILAETGEEIGQLGDPIGNVERPYQAVLLYSRVLESGLDLVGMEVQARISKRRKKRYYKKRR